MMMTDNTMWEVFYKLPVTDNITITPAIFGIDDGDLMMRMPSAVIVKTTFKF